MINVRRESLKIDELLIENEDAERYIVNRFQTSILWYESVVK
ncbi:hypothetical protein [Oceanobacillus senegalensis]|nr:hypothetical protein [Oceanobacillus senegalensis]